VVVKKLTLLLLAGIIAAQTTPKEETPQPYHDPEAYAIYSAIIQNEWANLPPRPERLFISDQTVILHKTCFTPHGESRAILGPAIAEYLKVNQERRSLKPEFHIDKPYELVTASKTTAPFWIGFSGVGFNDAKTVAVVSVDSVFPDIGSSNGSGTFIVLFKKNGKWQRGKWSGNDCAWVGSIASGH
jgi:hypothetical protein